MKESSAAPKVPAAALKKENGDSVSASLHQLSLGPKSPSFSSNCSAAQTQTQSRLFQCRELVGHTGGVFSFEFSEDGRFLVSGNVGNGTVRLWSLYEGTEGSESPSSSVHQIKTKHDTPVLCAAISSDNNRIFSGGYDSKVLIHDAKTY